MEEKDYRLAAIMYTDIVGFSKMMGENERETLALLEIHNHIIEESVAIFHGNVIKTIGDAYMVDFRNTVEALQCAIAIQEKLYEYNVSVVTNKILIRIGLHLGDIYFYEKDAFGDGVNIAARLQSFAKPGCICFSQDIFNQVLHKIDFHAENLGEVSLKNITKEIFAYEIETKNSEFDTEKTVRNRKITSNPIEDDEANEKLKNTAFERNQKYFTHAESTSTTDDWESLIEGVGQKLESCVGLLGKKLSGYFEKLDSKMQDKQEKTEKKTVQKEYWQDLTNEYKKIKKNDTMQ
ncbi:MAG: adenylate/guanylate cyclase domain-containing protein [Spirochaetaceae bacterium]|nr:adenylate/guanylate cyclase domain-containing protein [Spirochaetaceae bacterium]